MEKLKDNFIFFIISIVILATGIHSQRADVSPKSVIVSVGQNVSMLCRFAQPLLYCRIELPNKKVQLLSPQWNNDADYEYYGEGLDAGHCGMTIRSVKPEHNGIFHCTLGTKQGTEVPGDIEVIVAQAPIRPEIEFPQNSNLEFHEINTEFRAMCVSRDGRPAANLSWYLENDRLTNDNVLPEIIESQPDGKNTTLFTAKLEISRILRAEDDRKTLVCRAEHVALERGFEEVRTQLNVQYEPQTLSPTHLFALRLGQTAFVSVVIRANPRPSVQWSVNGITVSQGTRTGRYEAYEPMDLGSGQYNVTLTINELTLEDTTKVYTLSARNALGPKDYMVKISSSEAEPETGMDIGAIVGIAVGCVVILLVIILVVIARITGRWCFSGGSHRTDTGLDSEAQVAHNYDDNEKDHEEYHPQENGHPNSTDVTDEAKHEPLTNGNGNTEVKTNTSV